MRLGSTQIWFVVLSAIFSWIAPVSAQESSLPDAQTLMEKVWQAEERIKTVRGTYTSRYAFNQGGVTSSHTRASNIAFALEVGKRFRYEVTRGGGYTIIATRERVTRRFPQVLEEFPVSVWDSKPPRLWVEVMSEKQNIESLVRPLHGTSAGFTDASALREFFKDAAVSVAGDLFLVHQTEPELQAGITYYVALQPAPHLVQIDWTGILGPTTHKYDGQEFARSPGIWVTTQYERVSGPPDSNFSEINLLAVDWESLNVSLPDELFEVDETNAAYVDYNKLIPRLEIWISDGVFDDPAYSFENFSDMFPGLFVGLLALLAIVLIAVVVLTAVFARRLWRYRKSMGAE